MTARLQDRLFAACGVLFVVLELGGALVAMGSGKTHSLTVSSTTSDIAKAIAHPVGAGTWAGAYMEVVSVCFFLAFAAWMADKLGGGLVGGVARLTAAATAGVTLVSLGVGDAISYEAGHGMSVGVARALVTVNEAAYVCSWFAVAAFLAAAGILALRSGRRVLAWSAFAIVALTLVLTPLSLDNLGQLTQLLWLLWAAAASIALVRRPVSRTVPAVATV
ncbi:MAG TPA: hypothetical protein VKR23_05200 [Gaiellaceae bacterium]|nr:hypothetical protein [Gaiellaceae bacterium]